MAIPVAAIAAVASTVLPMLMGGGKGGGTKPETQSFTPAPPPQASYTPGRGFR
jgi:hypothetical protein